MRQKISDVTLSAQGIETIRSLPKGEAHSHGVIAAPLDIFRRITQAPIPNPPARFDSFEDFLLFLRVHILPQYRSVDIISEVFTAVFQSMVDDGVTVAELSFDAMIPLTTKSSWSELAGELRKIISQFSGQITIKPEIGFARETPPKLWRHQIDEALKQDFFYSCDLYGDELFAPIEDFAEYFSSARAHGLKIKLHTGEFAGPERVAHEIRVVRPDAIQHGNNAIGSPECEESIRDLDIVLNMCPTSNFCLGAVPNINNHPIGRAIRSGLRVTIGTDDRMIFQRSLSEEYWLLYSIGVLTAKELELIRQESLKL